MIFSKLILSAANLICDLNSEKLCNPTHAASLRIFVENVLTGIGIIIGLIAVVMVVQSAYKMVKARGNEENLSEAKSALQWSVSGLVLIMLAFVIVSAVADFFGANDINPNPGEIKSPIGSNNLIALSEKIIGGFLSVVGLLAVFFIVYGGFKYLTARGNEEQVTEARSQITWALIGLAVAALAYVIVTAVSKFITP